jgi:hypothetical protein
MADDRERRCLRHGHYTAGLPRCPGCFEDNDNLIAQLRAQVAALTELAARRLEQLDNMGAGLAIERDRANAVEARAKRLETFAREVAASYTIREAPGIGTDAGWYEADGTTWIDLRERARRAMGET